MNLPFASLIHPDCSTVNLSFRDLHKPRAPGRRAARRAGGTAARRRHRRSTWRARARERRERLHPHIADAVRSSHVTNQVVLVVQVQLAERRVRARARCQVDAEGVLACAGLPRSEDSACGRHVIKGVLVARVGVRDRVGPKSASPRVASACFALRVSTVRTSDAVRACAPSWPA